jgi:hypothetical protein
LNVDRMISAVDSSLYRQRVIQNPSPGPGEGLGEGG